MKGTDRGSRTWNMYLIALNRMMPEETSLESYYFYGNKLKINIGNYYLDCLNNEFTIYDSDQKVLAREKIDRDNNGSDRF